MIAATQLPRLLHAMTDRPLTLDEHEAAFQSNFRPSSLLDELDASGLTGRGGAAFPTAVKARFLREQRGRHKYVVVNAMEGEPAAHKDRTLLATNPHLVIDGAEILAAIVGATRVAVCVARDNATVVNHVARALHERARRRSRGIDVELHTPPWRYVAGEESALVHWLDDNESLPQYRPRRPHVLRIGHDPVLLDNAETCANVALIARFGAAWYRSLGTHASPGTQLVSVSGAVARPVVLEVVLGTPMREVLAAAGADPDPQALLLGGYGGTWLSSADLDVTFDNASLETRGASVGAGVLVVVPQRACGLVETQRVVRWMANESARQCGPCAFGLPAMAEDLALLVRPSRDPRATLERLQHRAGLIQGRGACHHPDGVVRFVRSALEVFAHDVATHASGRACAAAGESTRYVTVPRIEHEEELTWE